MSILSELSRVVGEAFERSDLDRRLGTVVVSQRPDLAQFQCNGALAAAKEAGRPPRDLAEEIAKRLRGLPWVHAADVAGAGFLNITLTDHHLADSLTMMQGDPQLGVTPPETPRTVIIDYGGPNVAKDLHVGHIRPALIGESIKRLYKLAGHNTKGDIHLGDWGLPMGQLIAALQDTHSDLAYFDDQAESFPADTPVTVEDLQALYPRAALRFSTDDEFQARARAATVALQQGRQGYRALWRHFRSVSVAALSATYDRLGVHFELWLGEASVAERSEVLATRLISSGIAVESDGAYIIEVAESEDTAPVPPLMLVNSRGGSTYATTDLATLDERIVDWAATDVVYVVDLRQSLHFVQLFRAARLAGIASNDLRLTHAGNGTVNGPDGKPFKTRQGGLPRLNELLDDVDTLAMQRLDENDLASELAVEERSEVARMVGLAALKFGELSNHRATNYSFDLERFTQMQGRTGPYLLYVAVRTQSVLDRLAVEGIHPSPFTAPSHDAERALALLLSRWPDVVEHALDAHSPNTVAEYAYEVSGAFNQFYDACHILSESNPAQQGSWLSLVSLTRSVLIAALDVLLIEVPLRM